MSPKPPLFYQRGTNSVILTIAFSKESNGRHKFPHSLMGGRRAGQFYCRTEWVFNSLSNELAARSTIKIVDEEDVE